MTITIEPGVEARAEPAESVSGRVESAAVVAYLVNQYPQPSQSFIRREVRALRSLGFAVETFTLRRGDTKLVDHDDLEEANRTRAILDGGPFGLLCSLLLVALTRPAAFARSVQLAMRVGRRSVRGLAYHLVYLAEACVLLRWLEKSHAEHIHAHFGTNSTTVAMLCRSLGGPPFSFTAHGPEEFDKPEFWHLPDKISRATFVIGVSEFGRSQLYRWCNYRHWSKIHVVHCGVDESYLTEEVLPVPAAARLVCVARLHEQKGLPMLMEAAEELASEGLKFELRLVGDGPLRPQIEEHVRRCGLEGVITMLGWRSGVEVRNELTAARALVLPSFAEGLPVVIMEALAMGRPVLGTYVAGIPELVQPGVCGWLVPPGALSPLVSAMRDALTRPPEELARMGRAGAKVVARHHDAAREAAKLAALIRQSVCQGK